MKRINAYLILGILLPLCCLSCENSKEKTVEYDSERLDDTTPEFDSNRQSIIYKEYMSHDIKGNIAVPYTITNTINNKFCCEFSFFNYGEDIRLFNGCEDDTFITGI